jgi:hypothetical protein
MVLLVVGVIGLFVEDMPGADSIKWAVALSLVAFIADIFVDRKKIS